ncbi:IS5 family transposase [Paracoccus lutimaris]|uniref:IS5 family transposase n=1 Tax=Paracoccus lutimaris TaxID=1490030 RepID=UPI000DF2A4AC
MLVSCCLWVLRSGAHWCDLPERYGKRQFIHRWVGRWCHVRAWQRVFEAPSEDCDNRYLMIGSIVVRMHQQATAGKGRRNQALRRSRGGLTTEIHMLADALGRPLRFLVAPGQAGDITAVPALLGCQQGRPC